MGISLTNKNLTLRHNHQDLTILSQSQNKNQIAKHKTLVKLTNLLNLKISWMQVKHKLGGINIDTAI